MKPGDLVQHRGGWFDSALVVKINGHSCSGESAVSVMKANGETVQIKLSYLQVINTSHNFGNK